MRRQQDDTVHLDGDRRRDGTTTSCDRSGPPEGSTLDPALREKVRLPHTIARRVEGESPSALRMPPGSLWALDRSGHTVALFRSSFDLDAFRNRNPGVRSARPAE